MNELLLQTIVEKLAALETVLRKKDDRLKDDSIQTELIQQTKSFHAAFDGLKSQLRENAIVLKGQNSEFFKIKKREQFC